MDGTATLDENNRLIQDDVGGDITIICTPPSGSEFPIGSAEVQCTATDEAGNTGTASFTVTVNPVTCEGEIATIVGTPGDDDIVGTEARDVIAALAGDDEIQGLGGDDLICGDEGSDTMVGGAGDDDMFGVTDSDIMDGGAGNDALNSFDGVGNNDSSDGGTGIDQCTSDPGDTEVNCEP